MSDPKDVIEEEKTPIMETLSNRLIELKNSEKEFQNRVGNYGQLLNAAQADLIAVRGRIDEVTRLIDAHASAPPDKP